MRLCVLLKDPEWSKWSAREIARQCAVDHKTVTSIRAELGINDKGETTIKRNGKDFYTEEEISVLLLTSKQIAVICKTKECHKG